MIKNLIFVVFFGIFFSFSQKISDEKVTAEPPFKKSEWFQLRIHYGIFNASYATLSLERDTIKGRPVFHAKAYGKTTGLANWFFKVEDYYESYFDEITILPYEFIRDINEGGYTKKIAITFDQELNTALVNNLKKETIQVFDTQTKVQDLISCFYYLRHFYPKKGIEINESFDINMFFDQENYVFKLKYLGKESINSKFGKIDCLKFRPVVQSGRVFKEQESVTLWVSDDKNKLPIRLQADILVGSIKADLENFKNLKHPFKITID
ncbi:MAG: hypothetical protein ACI9TK_000401 [Flavobacteriaceae bacterium]|jgi:hypothetical protein|tara:strand:- start:17330 stop:18127 length:798 start_codon:yes stop_codon:yes gene_type:complete